MPLKALASQGMNATPWQQLNAQAGLHERVRQGQPAATKELRVSRASLPPGARLVDGCASFTATNEWALAVWAVDSYDTQTMDVEREMGAQIVGKAADGTIWSASLPSSEPLRQCACGSSADGRYCITLSEVQGKQDPRSSFARLMGLGTAVARTFDLHERCWLPSLPVQGCSVLGGSISVCGAAGPMLAATAGSGMFSASLIVFGVLDPFIEVISDVARFHWLADARSIVLLRRTALARPDLPSALASGSTGELVQVPFPETLDKFPGMAFVPDTSTAWVAQALAPPALSCLCVYSTSDMSCRGSWRCDAVGRTSKITSLEASQVALAVSVGSIVGSGSTQVCVFALKTPCELGQQLFRVSMPLQGLLQFLLDRRWMLGVCQGPVLSLIDAHVGSCVQRVQFTQAEDVSLECSACDPGQVVVRYFKAASQDVVFKALQL